MRLDHNHRLRAYELDSCHVNEGFCHVGLGVQGHMGCWGSEWYYSGEGECIGEGCGVEVRALRPQDVRIREALLA
nr:hypothetical protein [Tanacetum cinerariifolium]